MGALKPYVDAEGCASVYISFYAPLMSELRIERRTCFVLELLLELIFRDAVHTGVLGLGRET